MDRLRATSGELVEVTRPVQTGDQVTIDIHGTRSGPGAEGDDDDLSAEDYLYEVGSGGVVPELDDQLLGAKAGDILEFESTLGAEDQTVLVPPAGEGRAEDCAARARPTSGRPRPPSSHTVEELTRRHRRAAAAATDRRGPDGPPTQDDRGAGRAGHRGDPRAAGARGAPRADPRPQPPARGPGDEPRRSSSGSPARASRSSWTSSGPERSRA